MPTSSPPKPDEMLHIRVPTQLAEELRRLAADSERSLTATARIALKAHIERERAESTAY